MVDPRIHRLYSELASGQLDRRGFMKAAAALGVSASAASLFVQAASVRAQDAATPPPVATGDGTLFAGQEVTVQVIDASVKLPLEEARAEYEAATGAKLTIVADPIENAFPKLLEDAVNGTNAIDGSVIGMWWLGELVEGDFVLPYDDMYADASGKFPAFNAEDEFVGMQALRVYDGKRYVVPYDCDGQVLYYRRDVLTDQKWMDEYKTATGNDLRAPETWDEMLAIAQFFNGKDFNGDGPGNGISMHLKVGGQGMFHYMSLSAPFVMGETNASNYWFNPEDMVPLIQSAGHVKAMQTYLDLAATGPEAQLGWALGEAWDHFLKGHAIFTFSWGDVLPLAVEQKEPTNGKIGTAQLPGTMAYTDPLTGTEAATTDVNYVGNTTGGSWSPVVMKASEVAEATYYFWAMLATEAKQRFYAARGSDGVDPGKWYQMPPEAVDGGTGRLSDYTDAGFTADDAIQYCRAFFDNFNNPKQLPYLRIPGAAEYWSALDIRLSEAVSGGQKPEDACANTAGDWEAITDRLGRDLQKESYRKSLGL
ncbi:MAG TPA: extracellular solute-binding protein [Thermomicrobiales bacterium]|nr:extracellular solute-binding protein [Thermomicrobiales bacterium]